MWVPESHASQRIILLASSPSPHRAHTMASAASSLESESTSRKRTAEDVPRVARRRRRPLDAPPCAA